MVKSANIVKFKTGKTIINPQVTIRDSGSYACPPYMVNENLTELELAEKLLQALEVSGERTTPPTEEEMFFYKETIKETGIKNMKMLHKDSINVSVYTRDDKYYISPSINKGSRQGFHYTKDRIVLPINSPIEEIANALYKAFERSS